MSAGNSSIILINIGIRCVTNLIIKISTNIQTLNLRERFLFVERNVEYDYS